MSEFNRSWARAGTIAALALIAIAAITVASGSGLAAEKRSIVLVHGAWGGAFTQAPLARLLREQGHTVFAPDLKGHGKRAAESGPHVTLEDHVQDIVKVFETNDLKGATLVMHSYGGVPGTLAWERLGDRVAHVVYLDAFAPVDDSAKPLQYFWQRNQNLPYKIVDGMVPPPVGPRPGLVSQSLRTLTDDMSLRTGALPAGTTRTYVWANRNPIPGHKGVPDGVRQAVPEPCLAALFRAHLPQRDARRPGGRGSHRRQPLTGPPAHMRGVRQPRAHPENRRSGPDVATARRSAASARR